MTEHSTYIEVAIALPIRGTFTYTVPESFSAFVSVGKRVLIPFGRQRVTGYILGMSGDSEHQGARHILDLLDETPLFPEPMIPFFRWIADYYMYPLGQVIRCALPGGMNPHDITKISITGPGEQALTENAATPLQAEVLIQLRHHGPCALRALCKNLNRDISHSLIRVMAESGWVEREKILSGGTTKARMERYVALNRGELPSDKLSEERQHIIEILKFEGELAVKDLKKLVPKAPALIKLLEKKGCISIFKKKVCRDPFGDSVVPDTPPTLTEEQEKAVREIMGSPENNFATYLLAGVTGSGKTEVYMRLASEVIRQGKSVLVLVPEIALISQMEHRFRARFGEQIAVLHSGLSAGERYDQWMRIMNGEVAIAVGARSAIFAPFSHIGMIIVDEEHDTSYKQEHELLYNARDIAVLRAKLMNAVALLGTATPSVQSCHNVSAGKFVELSLNERVEKRPLPNIHIVDLRKSKEEMGARRFITAELYQEMEKTLTRGEQMLIFLNRRGFAGFPVCGACGDPVHCENCDVTLTLHRSANAYKCHYCGFTLPSASRCPTCNSPGIKLLGIGTEKIEAAVKKLFPDARVDRMDRDTTTKKGSLMKILKRLREEKTDILVGTQMITKGHDFPNITLVGIICADLSLCFPDFRAGERTFQLLAQVAGRAGRGDVPGKVILQTYNPAHFSIMAAKRQNFREFHNTEIEFRKALNYPPFSRLIQLKMSGKDKTRTRDFARDLGAMLRDLQKGSETFLRSVQILGPIEASISKIAKRYRWQILLKGRHVKTLHHFVRQGIVENPPVLNQRHVKVVVDVDPFFMF